MHGRRIRIEPGRYTVIRAPLPPPRDPGTDDGTGDGALRAELRAAGEPTAILPESEAPGGVPTEGGWRWLRVIGPLDLGEVGVLASLAAPLAEAKVSIFVLSTYDTDHVLVKESTLPATFAALEAAGWDVVE